MNITAADVNKLRKQTGAGMMDCKNALVEAEGDFEKAIDVLRKKGIFFPLRAICLAALQASSSFTAVLLRSMMWIPFFSPKM